MDRSYVIRILRLHERELKDAGIAHLRLFGSLARNEAQEHSDVDLLAGFDSSRHLSLVKVGRLQMRLSELLSAQVDLSSADWMKEPIRSRVLSEAVLAF
jgi:predicted nucleotidyltransferase